MEWASEGRNDLVSGGRAGTRRIRLACLGAALATALIAAGPGPAAPASAAAADASSRYSLAGGCFALRSESTGGYAVKNLGGYVTSAGSPAAGEPFRMQATDLGRYLLYGAARDFLAASGSNGIVNAASPSDSSDWTVTEDGGAFRIANGFLGKELSVGPGGELVAVGAGTSGDRGRFAFVARDGCPAYPEVDVNVEGGPATGETSYGEVTGMVEGHMHMMAFEFLGGGAHCGRPWHRFGAPYALSDCVDHTATNGCGAVLENVLYGNPARCHDTVGWPTFAEWPDPKSLTHEQSYYKWLERAWRGGLRVFVNLLVENRVLCELYPFPATGKNSCDEMDAVRLQAQRLRELERYIDAQSGGPGKGWFRIVENPFEARGVINSGKLAVVMGMEVSEPFGCRLAPPNQVPQCDSADVDAGIDEIHALGVRQLELINKFDNAIAGVAGDSGSTGTITNTGNFSSTGKFWNLDTCQDPHNADHSPTAIEHNDDLIVGNGLDAFGLGGTAPAYPPGPHCNRLGLSSLGDRAVRRIASKQMIFDPDHMSVVARNQAMDVVESLGYPGVISSHSWSTENALPRIYKLGGMVTPYAGDSEGFVRKWQTLRKYRDRLGDQYYGVGYGADMNGLGGQGGPRGAGVPNPVTYPFRSADGSATIHRQVSGQRTFDINTDGVAHYGLYPDWVEDLRKLAGDQIVADMNRSAEAYLEMWERAEGVAGIGCRAFAGRFERGGLGGRVNLGAAPVEVLYAAGQPERRARVWRWCALSGQKGKGKGKKQGKRTGVKSKKKKRGKRTTVKRPVIAVFDDAGRVGLVLSSVRDHRAAKVRPGARRASLPKGAKRAGKRLFVKRAGQGRRFVFVIRKRRVAYTGVASASLKRPSELRRHLALAGLG